jgi:hypothetical protein
VLDQCGVLARSGAAVFVRDGARLVMRDCRVEHPNRLVTSRESAIRFLLGAHAAGGDP